MKEEQAERVTHGATGRLRPQTATCQSSTSLHLIPPCHKHVESVLEGFGNLMEGQADRVMERTAGG